MSQLCELVYIWNENQTSVLLSPHIDKSFLQTHCNIKSTHSSFNTHGHSSYLQKLTEIKCLNKGRLFEDQIVSHCFTCDRYCKALLWLLSAVKRYMALLLKKKPSWQGWHLVVSYGSTLKCICNALALHTQTNAMCSAYKCYSYAHNLPYLNCTLILCCSTRLEIKPHNQSLSTDFIGRYHDFIPQIF